MGDPSPAAWLHSAAPPEPEPITEVVIGLSCADPSCATCVIAAAGARVMCQLVGVDYDALEAEHQVHYRTIASEVMAAMSAALIESGLVT